MYCNQIDVGATIPKPIPVEYSIMTNASLFSLAQKSKYSAFYTFSLEINLHRNLQMASTNESTLLARTWSLNEHWEARKIEKKNSPVEKTPRHEIFPL